jgi:putative ABC transport system permease protein
MTLTQDIVFGLRMLRKNPALSAVAIIALTLGIGANATVFTIVNAFLFENLPFADSERILYISSTNTATGKGRGESYPDFRDFRSEAKSFASLGAFSQFDVDVSDKTGLPVQYKGAHLTPNTFAIIGQKPIVGRDFLPADASPGATPVAILSYSVWENRYGKNPAVIGTSIRINEVPSLVIGVMPLGIQFPGTSQLWIPLVPAGDWEKREYRGLTMFGRLAPTATIESARAEITTVAGRLESQYPATNKGIGAEVETYNDYFTNSDTRLVYLALLGAVGFVLLIACANVANLLLTRAGARAREISVRNALGAGRWRVIRQLLVESLILSVAGGILGSIAGVWGVRFFVDTLITEDTPAYLTFTTDYRVIAYLAAITVATGILFGLAPALSLSRLDFNAVLKAGGHGSSLGSGARRFSSLLVVTEVALAFVLLVGAGLMVRSFLNMAHTPMGVRTDHLMSMDIILRARRYPNPASQVSFHRQLKARLETLPGVKTVAIASNLPGDGWTDFGYELEGSPAVDVRKLPRTGGVIVSPEYFPVLEIHSRRGRTFTDSDGITGVPVVIVNESFARMAWPSQDALGRRLRIQRPTSNAPAAGIAQQPWLAVVGVIPDIIQSDTSQGSHDPLVYIPFVQLPQREMVFAARTLVPPENLSNAFRREVQALDADLPITDVRTLDSLLWERTRSWRVYGSMFSIFAAMALLMAAVGLYGVIAQSVSQRTREIGVRMAIGASTRTILGMVFAQGMRQLIIGLAAGLVASFVLTQVLASQLVGVKPADPVTLVAVALVLTLAGVVGCALPARRAMKVDPVIALRYE